VLEADQIVGTYRVECHVGSGAMGEVYRVRHVAHGTAHALKFLALPSGRVRERILLEAEIHTRLAHDNVVTFTEVIDIGGDPALIMEFVDGPALDKWLGAHTPSLAQAEALFRGIAAGVAHAHSKGLVHRDLKPANVLLAGSGAELCPKVADFGLAKILGGDAVAGLTRSGISLGSPAYMSPEQIRDARQVDQRADLFSLGCILYELVCGQRAFQGPDVLAVMNAAIAARYSAPQLLRPELPDRFVRAIEGCLQVDPNRRVQSCEALLGLLNDGDSKTLPVAEVRGATPRGVRRAPPPTADPTLRVVAGAAVVLLALVALLAWFLS
jgi:serine/threonine-protein kinase